MKRTLRGIAVLFMAVLMLSSVMSVSAFAAGITGDLPGIRTVTDGDNVTFSLAFDGTVTDVQWYRNGSAVASGSLTYSFSAGVADNGAQYYATVLDSENYVYTSNTCTLTVNPRQGGTAATPAPTASPAPTATPTPEVVGPPTVTKDPTGETVSEGDYAIFIARADNADEYIWRVVSPDRATTYTVEDACRAFPPLRAEGLGTERLVLDDIPLTLNGWKVECKFVGPGGNAFSKGALLTVNKAVLKAPTIDNDPKGFSREVGESGKLMVKVTELNGGDLNFQWYCGTANASTGGTPVAGATSYEFTVPQTEGTFYYYVEVWSTKGDMKSDVSVSKPAEVTYFTPQPSPSPTPEATPTPEVTAAPETSPAPSNPGNDGDDKDNDASGGSSTALIIFLIIAALGAAAAVTALVIVNKRLGAAPKAAKAAPVVYYVCDNCGWEPPDPNKLPRYCPGCGELFDEDAEE